MVQFRCESFNSSAVSSASERPVERQARSGALRNALKHRDPISWQPASCGGRKHGTAVQPSRRDHELSCRSTEALCGIDPGGANCVVWSRRAYPVPPAIEVALISAGGPKKSSTLPCKSVLLRDPLAWQPASRACWSSCALSPCC